MLKCVAIDDEPLAVDLIKGYLGKIPELQLVQTFDDALSGAEFLRKMPVDILFIDINMPDITGMELVKSLDIKPAIIFTTAYKKFAAEGFDMDAIDYLLKPFSFERFLKAANKAIAFCQYKNRIITDEENSLFISSSYKMIRIALHDIEYIESLEDYIRIHLVNAKPVLTLMPLKKIMEKLPPEKFRRIHRSYIVSTDKIKSVFNKKVTLSFSQTELPVGDTYSGFIRDWKSL
jgi:two-component system, LytTR family, response regulator